MDKKMLYAVGELMMYSARRDDTEVWRRFFEK